MIVCLRVLKENNRSRFDNYSVKKSVLIISQITFRDSRVRETAVNHTFISCMTTRMLLDQVLDLLNTCNRTSFSTTTKEMLLPQLKETTDY